MIAEGEADRSGHRATAVTTEGARARVTAMTLLATALLALALWMAATFLPALLWAGVVAIAIHPLYQRIEARWPRHRGGALLPALVTTGIGLLVILPIAFCVVRAAHEARDLIAWLAVSRQTGLPQPAWVAQLPFGRDAVAHWWQLNLATPQGAAWQFDRFDTATLFARSRNVGSNLLHRSVVFAFTLIALFFLLKDGDAVTAQARVASDRLLGPAGMRLGRQIILSVRGTIDGLVLVGIGEGVVMTIVYLAAGVPHPILIGALTAVAAMIPFGAALLFGIAGVLLLLKGSLAAAIVVIGIGLVVVGIADHFVRPVLIGGATKLPFLWVLIGILGGVESFGLLGLFIGPAIMAALMLLWRELVQGAASTEPVVP